MKKFIGSVCLVLVGAVLTGAEQIDEVYFNPSPLGKYDSLRAMALTSADNISATDTRFDANMTADASQGYTVGAVKLQQDGKMMLKAESTVTVDQGGNLCLQLLGQNITAPTLIINGDDGDVPLSTANEKAFLQLGQNMFITQFPKNVQRIHGSKELKWKEAKLNASTARKKILVLEATNVGGAGEDPSDASLDCVIKEQGQQLTTLVYNGDETNLFSGEYARCPSEWGASNADLGTVINSSLCDQAGNSKGEGQCWYPIAGPTQSQMTGRYFYSQDGVNYATVDWKHDPKNSGMQQVGNSYQDSELQTFPNSYAVGGTFSGSPSGNNYQGVEGCSSLNLNGKSRNTTSLTAEQACSNYVRAEGTCWWMQYRDPNFCYNPSGCQGWASVLQCYRKKQSEYVLVKYGWAESKAE